MQDGQLGVKNFFLQKYAENECTRRIKLFCAKNRWKRQPVFEKGDHFENRPFW